MPFAVGDRFDSFNEFAAILKDFEETENVQFYRANSKRLEKCWQNGYFYNKVEEGYNKDLVFFEAYYKCKTINRKKNKTKCKAKIVLGVHKKRQLFVKKSELEHNHQLVDSNDRDNLDEETSSEDELPIREKDGSRNQEPSLKPGTSKKHTKRSGYEKIASQEKAAKQKEPEHRAVKTILKMLGDHLAATPADTLEKKLDVIEEMIAEWEADTRRSSTLKETAANIDRSSTVKKPATYVKKSSTVKESTVTRDEGLSAGEELAAEPESGQVPGINYAFLPDERNSLDITFGDISLDPLSDNEMDKLCDAVLRASNTLNTFTNGNTTDLKTSNLTAAPLLSLVDKSTKDENGNVEIEHRPVIPKPQIVHDELLQKENEVMLPRKHRLLTEETQRNVVRKIDATWSPRNHGLQHSDEAGLTSERDIDLKETHSEEINKKVLPESPTEIDDAESAASEAPNYDFSGIDMPQKSASRGRPRGSKTVTVIGLRRSKNDKQRSQKPSTAQGVSAKVKPTSRGRPRGSRNVTVVGVRRSKNDRQRSQKPSTAQGVSGKVSPTSFIANYSRNVEKPRMSDRITQRQKSLPIKFVDKPVLSQVQKMLQWLEISDDTCAKILSGSYLVKKTDLRLNPLTLRDSFSTDEANIGSMRCYFDSGAFDDFERAINAKKKLGQSTCKKCSKRCRDKALLCAGCLLRWHDDCVASSDSMKEQVWFCQSCKEEIIKD